PHLPRRRQTDSRACRACRACLSCFGKREIQRRTRPRAADKSPTSSRSPAGRGGRNMNIPRSRWLVPSLGLLVVGCLYPVQEKVDHKVCELAARPRDLAPDSYETPRTALRKPEPGV